MSIRSWRSVERGVPMLIEKPLATDLGESARVLKAIDDARLDAVVGYTQRFRRHWLAAKEKVRTGALGDVTMVTSRAFMNRLVAIDNYKRTDEPDDDLADGDLRHPRARHLHVVPGGEDRRSSVYARSVDKVLGPTYQGIDATAGMIMFSDGSVYHLNISWALPVTWPGAVYSLEVGIIGTTRRAHHRRHPSRHGARGVGAAGGRLRAGREPAGRLHGQLSARRHGARRVARTDGARRPMSWLNRMALGVPTQAATAAEAHNRLMLTKALDLSAKRKQPVKLPLEPGEERAAA